MRSRYLQSKLIYGFPFAIISTLTLTSALVLASSSSFADEPSNAAIDNIAIEVPEACSISAINETNDSSVEDGTGNATIDHGVKTIMAGASYFDTTTYPNGIATTTMSITCNDGNGYSLYAVGYSNNTLGNTNLIGEVTSTTIPTGTVTDSSVSNWAFKLSPVTGTFAPTITTDYDSYHTIPSTETKVATFVDGIDNGASVSAAPILTTTYALATAPTQVADTYTGKVKYTLVHPNYANADGKNIVTIATNNATNFTIDGTTYTNGQTLELIPDGSVHTIAAGTFPEGYEFDSWSAAGEVTVASTSTPNTTFTLAGNGTLTLNGKLSKVYMQDLTLANCPTGGMTVYDKRDESSYTVKKLADGNCWMTQNLALDLTALTQAQLYGTGTNAGKLTNASNTTLGYLKGATTGTTSDKYPTGAVTKAWTSSYSYSVPMIAVDSTTSGGCNNAYCVNGGTAGSPWSYSDSTSETINGVTSRVQGKIGVYYNYCAASAGSYCYGNGTSYGTPSGNASEDICPYGWHLPAGDTAQGSFDYLYNTGYSANYNNFVDALSTPLSGGFYSGKAYDQGRYGNFWSSTWNSSADMYLLTVNSTSVAPSTYGTRDIGYSVRCVFGS